MNPRSPTETLTSDEIAKLRTLVQHRGEKAAIAQVGLRSAEAFYKALAGVPVSRLACGVIRSGLDRI